MKVVLFTREFPPHVYGGAGVHVEYLARELARLVEVEVRCFGDQSVSAPGLRVVGIPDLATDPADGASRPGSPLDTVRRGLILASAPPSADVLHCHTWYTHAGGLLARLARGTPLVLTTHSLEPLRPWKREQLGTGYEFSCWVERQAYEAADAVVAVSAGTKADILATYGIPEERIHVIPNGIDTHEYRRLDADDALTRLGIDRARPYVLFVGRMVHQKGFIHLLDAAEQFHPDVALVLCAGAADSEEDTRRAEARVTALAARRRHVHYLPGMLPRADVIQLYSHAAVFCCPSIYEPFGLINLEAMACGTPVVASSVGGIREVVVPGETGELVPFEPVPGGADPRDPAGFARDLAAAVNRVLADPAAARRMGAAGRRRCEERFAWDAIARRTVLVYESLRRSATAA